MAWAKLGSFGTAGNSPGQFSGFWGFGITADSGSLYISDGNVGNRLAKFSKFSPYTFQAATPAGTNMYAPCTFSDGAIQGGFLYARDAFNPDLIKVNLSTLAVAQRVNATGPNSPLCAVSDATFTYVSPGSGTKLARWNNSNLTVSTTKTTATSPLNAAIDANNLYLMSSTTCYIWDKTSLTQTSTFAIAASESSNIGNWCHYNGYLFVRATNTLDVNVYSLSSKTLFGTIPNPTEAGGTAISSIFVDTDGVYVCYGGASKVVQFNNDVAPPKNLNVPGGIGSGLKKPNVTYDWNRVMGGY